MRKSSLSDIDHPTLSLAAIARYGHSITHKLRERIRNACASRAKSPGTADSDRQAEDVLHVSPGANARLVHYDAIMFEGLPVLLSSESEYRGVTAEDLHEFFACVQEIVIDAAVSQGYYIVDQAGAGVLKMTISITDLELRARNPSLLASRTRYWLNDGTRPIRRMTERCEVMRLSIRAEIRDSRNHDLLTLLSAWRNGHGRGMRFATVYEEIDRLGSALLCRFDERSTPQDRVETKCRASEFAAG
jgi:hypothetical protein